MKINLFFLEPNDTFYPREQLSFSFNKDDIKNERDKKAILQLIEHLFHSHCVEIYRELNFIDEIIQKTENQTVTLSISLIYEEPRLAILDLENETMKTFL